jgi:prepilin-type N-terminal cleavage/methylation domain-containing protein
MVQRAITGARIRRAGGRLRRRLHAEDGFTLIELMTTMLMLGIGLTAAFFFYSSAVGRTTDTEARVNTISDIRNLGERMARDVRESSSICAPLPAPSADVLRLSGPPNLGSTTSSSLCEASRMIVYDCETTPGTCTRAEGGGAAEILGEGLDTATPIFTKTADNYVSIYLSKTPDGRNAAITFERGAALRNYCEGGC